MQITKSEIASFQKEILDWYIIHKRDLPWRKDRDPYHILVSEVMLQQTQVQRVIPKYEAWMKAFPRLERLAQASTRDVFSYWSGLGYNRRALYLQKFAKEIVEKFAGSIPQDEKVLRSLPGIGEYTARALLCFAFDKQVVVIDTNIKKVIAVKFFGGVVPEKKILEDAAKQLLLLGNAYDWNQALMDYASSMLKEHRIPIPKQSTFKDSDRFYRGQLLKALIKHHELSFTQIHALFEQKNVPQERLKRIIEGMKKDKLLQENNKTGALFIA